jgi:hypothetical protein
MLRGINYDIGTAFRKGELSRPDFDEEVIQKEISIIKNELHCNAIKISGHDVERLTKASTFALQEGLQVWLTPSCIDAAQPDAIKHLADCAVAAEKLREQYGNIIMVLGFESSLFLGGFVKGETIYQRMKQMFTPWSLLLNALNIRNTNRKLNAFLKEAATQVKKYFKGQITYASGTWEHVDWDLFDFVGIDHYRAAYNKNSFEKELANYYKFNKPVVEFEFGCCAYKGADDKGPMGWAITEHVDGQQVIKGNFIRDENVQANYITDLLDIFERAQLHGAFVFTFVNPVFKHTSDPLHDLDLASYGIVKPVDDQKSYYKGLAWTPKEAFYKLAAYYGQLAAKAS